MHKICVSELEIISIKNVSPDIMHRLSRVFHANENSLDKCCIVELSNNGVHPRT